MSCPAPLNVAATPMVRVPTPAPWALASLDAVPLNTGFARAVVEGQVDGALWVDRPEAPQVLHALHPYGMSLVWGEAVVQGLAPVLAHLRDGAYRGGMDEWLQIDPRWQGLGWDRALGIPATPSADEAASCSLHTRINFRFDEALFLSRQHDARLPDGWRLRPATAEDFGLEGLVVPAQFWRDAAQFLAAGGGWCAEQDGRLGAIAFVSCRWGKDFEIGIETLAHARRRGLGRAAAARLIAEVLRAGLKPVWACRMENAASYQLAQALGFRPSCAIPYYRLSPCGGALPRGQS